MQARRSALYNGVRVTLFADLRRPGVEVGVAVEALVNVCAICWVEVSETSETFLRGNASEKALTRLGLARSQLIRALRSLGYVDDSGSDDEDDLGNEARATPGKAAPTLPKGATFANRGLYRRARCEHQWRRQMISIASTFALIGLKASPAQLALAKSILGEPLSLEEREIARRVRTKMRPWSRVENRARLSLLARRSSCTAR